MKKRVLFLATIVLSFSLLVACGNKEEPTSKITDKNGETVEPVTSEVIEADGKLFQNEEVGEGSFDLASPSGSTAEGKTPVVVYDPDTFPTALAISTENIDGSLLSFVYADGVLLTKEQYGTSQSEIELQDTPSAITEGKHVIQIVQYEADDDAGNITTFKFQEYEIKLK